MRLSERTARALVKQEFGLTRVSMACESEGNMDRYVLRTGQIEVSVENDWFSGDGYIHLRIWFQNSLRCHLLFAPKTLAEVAAIDGHA